VTLEEIDSVNDFIYKLEKIEPPNQLVAVIGDPLLQKFLQLRSSEASSKRIDDWLLAFFEDQLERQHSAELMILEMLNVVLEYTRYTKVLLLHARGHVRGIKIYSIDIACGLHGIPQSHAS